MPIFRCPLVGVGWLCLLLCMCAYTWGLVILRPGVLRRTLSPGLKIANPQVYVHIHNNRHNQPTPANGHLQIGIWHAGHALNTKHSLRGS